MALPVSDWAQGDVFVLGANTALAFITALKAALDAHPNLTVTADSLSGGGPSYYVEWRHSGGALQDMRYICGAGALPSKRISAAPGSDSSYIWLGLSPDAATAGPDDAWTAATPYTSARFAGFQALKAYSGAGAVDQLYLVANEEQCCLVLEDTGTAPNTVHAAIAGALLRPSTAEYADADGRLYGVANTGYSSNGISTSGPYSSGSGYGNLLLGYASNTAGYSFAWVYYPDSSVIEYVYGYLTYTLTVSDDRFTTPTGKIILCPFPLYGLTRGKLLGSWRQIYPFRGLRRQVIQDATPADTGYVLAVSDGTVYPAALFANA